MHECLGLSCPSLHARKFFASRRSAKVLTNRKAGTSSRHKSSTMTINPLDPQYQVSKDHLPDKLSTWTYPKEENGWVLAHNALRAEITELKKALIALQK